MSIGVVCTAIGQLDACILVYACWKGLLLNGLELAGHAYAAETSTQCIWLHSNTHVHVQCCMYMVMHGTP